MKLLVAGGAGFIGSTYVRRHLARATPTTRSSSSTSSPTPAAARTSPAPIQERLALRRGRHRRSRGRRARRSPAATRSSTSPPSRTSTARSPTPAPSSRPTSSAPTCCSRPPATPASATCRSPPTRSTARSSEGSFTETSPLDPSSPYSASKAGGDLIVSAFHHTYGADALITRASNNYGPYQHPEKLIPLMRPQRARRRPAARLRRRHAGPQLALRRGLRRRDRRRARARRGRAGLQRRRPRREAEHRGRQADPRAHRPRRVADQLRRRPPRPRPPLLALGRAHRGPRLEGRGRLRRGHRADRRLVPRQRGLVGPDPLRRVPRLLRAAVRDASSAADRARRRIETAPRGPRRARAHRARRPPRLPARDLSASRPGASSGSRARSCRRTTRARPSEGTLRGIHFQTAPGQGKLVRCVRGAIFDVAVDLRRGSPTYGQWEGHVLDDETHRQLWVPVGFGHGFQVLSEVADVAYKLTSLYDPETESQIAWDDPDVGIEWPIAEPVLSERDKQAPRLAEIGRRAARSSTELPAPAASGRRVISVAWPPTPKTSAEIPDVGARSPRSARRTRDWFERSFEGADAGPGGGLAEDRQRRQHADLRADRLGQDAGRVPLGDRHASPRRARASSGTGRRRSSTSRR